MDPNETQATTFFDGYRHALLDRDVDAIAAHYACPALIAFPGQTIAVTDPQQARDFFAAALGQYDGVTDATASVTLMGALPASLWADVTWTYDAAAPSERFCYQLLRVDDAWLIGVLTPM